uniref:Ig-like domain-containing protein n=1 Tax=Crocodylus porosus TaxID=8502 RepID=A0A7M4DVP8_CROPO
RCRLRIGCVVLWLHLTNSSFVQNPSHIIALKHSNTTDIVCVISEEYSIQGIYWYRWSKEKETFQFIVFVTMINKYTYGSGFDNRRFYVSKNVRNSHSLKIFHVQPSDKGTYYCAVSHSSRLILSSGTELSVGKCFFTLARICLGTLERPVFWYSETSV